MKKGLLVLLLFCGIQLHAQIQSKNVQLKPLLVTSDTLRIDTLSISPENFKIYTKNNVEIAPTTYEINFAKALLIFKNPMYRNQEISVQYTSYPSFLTKRYFKLNKKLIVPSANNQTQLYSLTTNEQKTPFRPFDGLDAAGNITRGVTVGNNQNAVVNSSLDLQIAGKLSDKVTLKASIIDTNLPIQENGNTYELNEFDRVFIELSSEDWSINAGDIYLSNQETTYLRFNKKVTGIGVNAIIKNENSEIKAQASGAFVRGKYNKVQFTGQEGNQGPYRITDFGNTSYVLILVGTEQIYSNGQLLKRGEEHDYVIDYNNGEITFNTTFPITGNMRITAEYQYNDRVYNRFITYDNATFESDKLNVGVYFYNENDFKNQSLEPELTNDQKQILADAGDNPLKMVAPSAYEEKFSESNILYKKVSQGVTEFYEYSNDENDLLYRVTFSYVGENLAAYRLKEVIATGKIYEYVGANLGDYAPVILLTAPNKLQVTLVKAAYRPSEKTSITTETAFSNNDANLFSDIDNENNKGLATKFGWKQVILQRKWELQSGLNYDYINKDFKTIERIQNVEFDRDWNIERIYGNQQLITAVLQLSNNSSSAFNYKYSNLSYGGDYTGNNHQIFGVHTTNRFFLNFNGSLLNNNSSLQKGAFLRYAINAKYNLDKSWFGASINAEKNEITDNLTDQLNELSQQYNAYEAYFGIGDSTKVYAQIGANFRTTDSIQNNALDRVNNAQTYYLRSNLVQSESSHLSLYLNYRTVENINFANEQSLNSKLVYQQQLWNQFVSWNTMYQTRSGTMPLQDYTYIETEPGQGFYMWIDYNGNGIKELNEFEIAQFPDQAKYLRVVLPTINYIATHQNIFSQSLILNPQQWASRLGSRKVLSHFYNQTSVLIDSKQKKEGNQFNLNPFDITNENLLGLLFSLNNSFYFNKGKKDFSTTYRYIQSQNVSTTTIDGLENKIQLHQLQFEHEIAAVWLLNLDGSFSKNNMNSTNFENRNYAIETQSFYPKFSYYFGKNSYCSLFYQYKNKENGIGEQEELQSSKIGAAANYFNNEKSLIKAEFNWFQNNFIGNSNTPVAFQMLEGLQPGTNYTWSLLFQRRLFSFLNLDINYLGRKSETSKTIHTGTVQLKAHF